MLKPVHGNFMQQSNTPSRIVSTRDDLPPRFYTNCTLGFANDFTLLDCPNFSGHLQLQPAVRLLPVYKGPIEAPVQFAPQETL
jgi:hypothetical protein